MNDSMLADGRESGPSLTRRLLLWSLGALVVVWASFVYLGYQTGVHEADELTDGHLASVAALLLNVRATEPVGGAQVTARAALPWLKAHDYQQSISVAQWGAEGRLLSLHGTTVAPAFTQAEGFATLTLGPDHVEWRSFSQWDSAHDRKIMVMLQLQERDDLANDIARQTIEPGLWLLPVVALALGLALWRGLRPLYALSSDVAALDPASAQRLPSRHVWTSLSRWWPRSIPCSTASRPRWCANADWPTKSPMSCALLCHRLPCTPARWRVNSMNSPRHKRYRASGRMLSERATCWTNCWRWPAPAGPSCMAQNCPWICVPWRSGCAPTTPRPRGSAVTTYRSRHRRR